MKKIYLLFVALVFISSCNTPSKPTVKNELLMQYQENGKLAYERALLEYIITHKTDMCVTINTNQLDSMYNEYKHKLPTNK